MSCLKAIQSPQNNGDFNALEIPSRCLGVSYFSCACTYFQWSTCQIHCLQGGFIISLHKHQTDGKNASAGGLRGCQVTGCHSSKELSQVYFGSWNPSCSGRTLLTDHHGPALPCFLDKWMLQVTFWIYPKGQCCWCVMRDCSVSPLLSHLPVWQSRSSLMQHFENWLRFFWSFF